MTGIRHGHGFDVHRLAVYLAERLPGLEGPLVVRQFSAGQSNPTFLLEAAGRRYVLRKKPPGELLPSAHMIEREYRVFQALAATPVPVPEPLLLCEDPGIIGTAFYVMAHVDGRIFRDPTLPECSSAERRAIYDAMADVEAALHGVDWAAQGLADFGKPTDYIARQIKVWSRQYEATRTHDIPPMERMMAWLPNHIPADASTTIAHGDFRLENLIFHAEEPRVVAILDWELATLGHPLADLAYTCMNYHVPYAARGPSGLAGLDLAALGIPDEAAYVRRYCQAAGRDGIDDWDFYMAFAMFRTVAILQGVYARALKGNASAENALEVGRFAATLADIAWAQVAHRA